MFTVVVSFDKKEQADSFIQVCQRMEFIDFLNELLREEKDDIEILDTTNIVVDAQNAMINFKTEELESSEDFDKGQDLDDDDDLDDTNDVF